MPFDDCVLIVVAEWLGRVLVGWPLCRYANRVSSKDCCEKELRKSEVVAYVSKIPTGTSVRYSVEVWHFCSA